MSHVTTTIIVEPSTDEARNAHLDAVLYLMEHRNMGKNQAEEFLRAQAEYEADLARRKAAQTITHTLVSVPLCILPELCAIAKYRGRMIGKDPNIPDFAERAAGWKDLAAQMQVMTTETAA